MGWAQHLVLGRTRISPPSATLEKAGRIGLLHIPRRVVRVVRVVRVATSAEPRAELGRRWKEFGGTGEVSDGSFFLSKLYHPNVG